MRLPLKHVFQDINMRRLVESVIQLAGGGSNAVGSFSLATTATTTTVQNALVTDGSRVFLQPTNAAAAAEEIFVSSITEGEFVVTHASAGTSRTFEYHVMTRGTD